MAILRSVPILTRPTTTRIDGQPDSTYSDSITQQEAEITKQINDEGFSEVPLTAREAEIVLWAIGYIGHIQRATSGDTDPLVILRKDYDDAMIVNGCRALELAWNYKPIAIVEPLMPVQRDILRLAVENASILHVYTAQVPGQKAARKQVHEAFLSLAHKLEELGIEIYHMPTIEG